MPDVPMNADEIAAAVDRVAKAVTSAMHDEMQKIIDGRPPDEDTPDRQYIKVCKSALKKAAEKL